MQTIIPTEPLFGISEAFSAQHPTPAVPSQSPTPHVLRISLTDRCNFHCTYCMPKGSLRSDSSNRPSLGELLLTVERLTSVQPVERVKITGGEPLMRAGVVDFVHDLSQISGVREISMTTNGSRLARCASDLRQAGLQRVNISLDTLSRERFRGLTGWELHDTLAGIDAAIESGLHPVKINAVLRRSTWREDVPQLLDFAAERGLQVRFIELMRTGTALSWVSREFISGDEVQRWIAQTGLIRVLRENPSAPARLSEITWKSVKIRVGWITPRSHPFCNGCTRLRLDSYGNLKRCLMDDARLNLPALFRQRAPAECAPVIASYLKGKRPPEDMATGYTMSAVGG